VFYGSILIDLAAEVDIALEKFIDRLPKDCNLDSMIMGLWYSTPDEGSSSMSF
jgi:hypothetical protein